MKILVTGAPGWLGSRFVEGLCHGLDGESRPFPESSVRCLVGPGLDPSWAGKLGVESVTGDLTRAETLGRAAEGVELVFHLAGVIHPKWRTAELFALNTAGTRNLLTASVQAGVKRFIYVSSNSVGGVNLRRDQLMTENDPPRPYMAYGRSKHLAEEAVNRSHQQGLLETVIIRPCWFYGPGQPLRQTRLFKMIKAGRPVVFGDGENLRSMSYIENTVRGLILSAKSEKSNGQTYWIADERPYRTIEIYETVARLLEVKNFKPRFLPNVVPGALRLTDRVLQAVNLYQMEVHVAGEMNQHIACSIDKAKRELGYAPQIALEEGMRCSIQWSRQNGVEI